MGTGYYVKQTAARMIANPRSAEARIYLERRFLDPTVSRAEAWQLARRLAWLDAQL